MLLSMTISNFKSVKSPQQISLVALKDSRLDITKTIPGTDRFNILKTTAIIGPNGAGKSSFVRAFEVIKAIVFASEDIENPLKGSLQKAAFAYGDGKARPSEISIDVLLDPGVPGNDDRPSIIARYSMAVTQERFYEESLYYIINGSKKMMFDRKYENGEYLYRFGKLYRGEKKRQVAKLPETKSFLQGAALKGGLTANEMYSWLRENLNLLPLGYGKNAEQIVIDALKAHPGWGEQLINFLWAVDVTDISRIRVVKNDKGEEAIGISHAYVNKGTSEAYSQVFMKESLSLRRLIVMAVSFFESFITPKTIVIDDFGQLLHPYVACHLVEIFNTCNTMSQLLVVDCNPALLEEDLLRKDSIWFAQKGVESSTEYFSLADFKNSKSKVSVYEKYLQGMYGAVPLESEFCFVHDGTPAVKKEEN